LFRSTQKGIFSFLSFTFQLKTKAIAALRQRKRAGAQNTEFFDVV